MLKRILPLLLIFCTMQATAQDTWTGLTTYTAHNRQLTSERNDGRRVVFMGNSITFLWKEKRPHFFKAHPNFIDRGISGQTTYQFLARFREDVINLKPKVVVINGATNDIAENQGLTYCENRTMGNIMSMVELAQAHKIKVILTSVLPTKEFYWNKSIQNVQSKVLSLNDRIKAYAQKQGIPYVDYYSAMVAGKDRALNPDYGADSVHPNAKGYEVMEAIILKALTKIVK